MSTGDNVRQDSSFHPSLLDERSSVEKQLDTEQTQGSSSQGRFIVFEGGEGSGKTTQLRRSHDWLLNSEIWRTLQTIHPGAHLVSTREPGGTDLGREIRQWLLHPSTHHPMHDRAELLLYAADRAQHVEEQLRPELARGALILCDRYTDSTIAYQGYGRGLDLTLIHQLNHLATGGLKSDLTLWLDVEVEVGLARTQRRGVADRMEQTGFAFHQRVRSGFAELAAAHPTRIVRVDANRSEAEVFATVQAVLQRHLEAWIAQQRDRPDVI